MPVSMSPAAHYVGSNSWSRRAIMRGKLTDRRIDQLRKAGYYDPDAIKARADYRRRAAIAKRGNFLEVDGRLIYSP